MTILWYKLQPQYIDTGEAAANLRWILSNIRVEKIRKWSSQLYLQRHAGTADGFFVQIHFVSDLQLQHELLGQAKWGRQSPRWSQLLSGSSGSLERMNLTYGQCRTYTHSARWVYAYITTRALGSWAAATLRQTCCSYTANVRKGRHKQSNTTGIGIDLACCTCVGIYQIICDYWRENRGGRYPEIYCTLSYTTLMVYLGDLIVF